MKTKKEELTSLLEYMTEEQCESINDLIRVLSNGMPSKGDFMKLAFSKEDNGKIDSAVPIDYVRSIQEIHPNFKTMHHAYSYVNGYGEMVNVSERLIEELIKKFDN